MNAVGPIVYDYQLQQGTPEWLLKRAGHVTSTDAEALLATPRKGSSETAGQKNLRARLIAEWLTGQPQETDFSGNGSMTRGTEKQDDALAAYELRTGLLAVSVGFVWRTDMRVGCSPDALVGDDGGVEVKCPNTAQHLIYRDDGIPTEYLRQITHHLFVTGRAWWDFVSYDDRLPEHLRLYVQRVTRTDVDLAAYELVARTFLRNVEAICERLRKAA